MMVLKYHWGPPVVALSVTHYLKHLYNPCEPLRTHTLFSPLITDLVAGIIPSFLSMLLISSEGFTLCPPDNISAKT